MKKLFAIFLVVFTLGACSSSDDGNNSSNSQITPPSWIQGTWGYEDGMNKFKFMPDDFCLIDIGSEICYKNINVPGTPEEYKMSFKQQISDSEYTLSIIHMTQTVTFKFKRKSNTEIYWVHDLQGNITLVKR